MATYGQGVGVLLAAFAVSQVAYLLVNLGFLRLTLAPRHDVAETDPTDYPRLEVLIPAYREDRAVLEETLDGVAATTYPNDRLRVHLVYDEGDDVVREYARELVAEYAEQFDTERTVVREDHAVWGVIDSLWHTSMGRRFRNKARALTYALYVNREGEVVQGRRPDGSLDHVESRLALDGVVTVLDADTGVPRDLFSLGVAGLEEYDVVQAKQTVRNHGDGLLPLWESMGIAAWTDQVYARTPTYPYQLLGKGYFLECETLYGVFGWDPTETTEDMALGLDAYAKGYELGVVDRYVQDLCPPRWRDWVRQKRRWVSGPYRALGRRDLSARDRIRFGSYALLNQSVSLVNLIGVPSGAYVLYATLVGGGVRMPTWLWVVATVNLLVWTLYTLGSYRATRDAVQFDTPSQRVWYYLLSNPLTQVLYATLWSVPVVLGLWAVVSGRRVEFVVTPKGEREGPTPTDD